jgi:hypothetical protein
VAVAVAGVLLPSLVGGFVFCYLFMDVTGWGNMTQDKSGGRFFPASLVVSLLLVHGYLRRGAHDDADF